jgi:proline iminopeptidase
MADQRRLLSALPAEMQAAVSDAERTGNFDSPAYQEAMLAYYRRHLCRLDPWPDCLNRTFDKMGFEVYLTMWGPSEFTATGNLREADLTPHLALIGTPTLITSGRHDEATPETAEYFRQLLPNARLEVFEDASHAHHLECTEQYLAMVRGFLAQVEQLR